VAAEAAEATTTRPPRLFYVSGGAGEYSSLQAAINAANPAIRVSILVAQGIYVENVVVRDCKALNIQGGWNSNFTARTGDRTETVLDGNLRGRVLDIWAGSGETVDVTVEGLTLRNGHAEQGAGILARAQGGTVILHLQSVIIAENRTNATVPFDGGGIFVESTGQNSLTRLDVQETTIRDNFARSGGGMAVNTHDSGQMEGHISRSQIIANTAQVFAAGIWINSNIFGSKTVITFLENEISDNMGPSIDAGALGAYASNGGHTSVTMKGNSVLRNQAEYCGGLFFYGWGTNGKLDVELANNLVAQNNGNTMFGGISLNVDRGTIGYFELTNNTVVANQAGDTAGGIFVASDGLLSNTYCMLRNNIVWGNTCRLPEQAGISVYSDSQSSTEVEAFYNSIEEVLIGGTAQYLESNNMVEDPLFTDFLLGDYRLDEGSPAIDGGDPGLDYNDAVIPPGQGTDRGDLGAYGGPFNNLIAF
jgi:hypothetical protein